MYLVEEAVFLFSINVHTFWTLMTVSHCQVMILYYIFHVQISFTQAQPASSITEIALFADLLCRTSPDASSVSPSLT